MTRPIAAAFGIAAIAAIAGLFVFALMPRPIAVDAAPVTSGSFRQTIDDDGKTRVRERYTVTAPVEGTLSRVALKAGDAVGIGSTLATIMPNPAPMLDERTRQQREQQLGAAEAALTRAGAAVERAQANLTQTSADLERTRILAAKGTVSRVALEHAELERQVSAKELQAAESDRHAAEHEVELARAALQKTSASARATQSDDSVEVRSPIAGRVLRVFLESEATVQAGTALFELADPSDLEVVVDVLTTDAVQIQPGASAFIDHWGGGKPLAARVRRVEPGAFTKVSALGVDEQRVNVILDIVAPKAEWRELGDAFRVDAAITVFEMPEAIKVPLGALFRDGEQWAVFAAVEGRARLRHVELIRRNAIEAAVSSGVSPGDTVIVYPSGNLRDGARIAIRPSENRG